MLAPAFPAPVIANQVVFRAVMDAVARPGEVKALPPAVGAPSPLNNTAALALALLDYETPLWLDPPLAKIPAVAEWIRFHTGARVTGDPRQAAFAFIADPAHAPRRQARARRWHNHGARPGRPRLSGRRVAGLVPRRGRGGRA